MSPFCNRLSSAPTVAKNFTWDVVEPDGEVAASIAVAEVLCRNVFLTRLSLKLQGPTKRAFLHPRRLSYALTSRSVSLDFFPRFAVMVSKRWTTTGSLFISQVSGDSVDRWSMSLKSAACWTVSLKRRPFSIPPSAPTNWKRESSGRLLDCRMLMTSETAACLWKWETVNQTLKHKYTRKVFDLVFWTN